MNRRALLGSALCAVAVVLAGCSSDEEPAGITDYWPASTTTTTTSSATAPTTSSAPVLPPPYIASATWVQTDVGPSLQIAPTQNGRDVASPTAGDEAWAEVLALDPSADTAGMKEQFMCHWTFARLVSPNKPTWNIEPGRPVVTPEEMIATRCNPGFAEE